MNFGFTEEQELLRDEVRKFLDDTCPMAEVRRIAESADGFSPELWKRMAELGWLGLTLPEEYGGAGLGWVDGVVLLEETGRSLTPSPLISHMLAVTALASFGDPAQQARWLPALAEGTEIGTLAILEEIDSFAPSGIGLLGEPLAGGGFRLTGEKRFVHDAGAATLFVTAFRSGPGEALCLALIERDTPGVQARNHPTMDGTKRLGTLSLADVRVPRESLLGAPGRALPALQTLLDRGAVAVTAEMIGAAEAAHRITVDFARERVQFDQPIGRFQGVKHPLAEMYVDIESTKSLCYYAAWAIDQSPDEVPRYASMAKAYASEAFRRIGIDCVQLHGGVGYTWEYDIQLYLKRSKFVSLAFGDAAYHYERVAALGGL
jgi:alkylation response protein AidB-like acyl-CoA dehydrogenase